MKPIVDARVVQTLSWVKDANAGWIKVPVGYEIQTLHEGSDKWESIQVLLIDNPNPEKDAEDGQGTA